jgi:site-specific DNA-methyltransferase (adenine-specific)
MDIKLINGDCLEVMKDIKDKSIDLILCDLPYGTTNCKWDSIIDLNKLWLQYERIIKDNGVILLTAQTPFDKVLGCSNLKLLKYEWIWEKTNATGHLNSKKMPMKAHENILVFYKNQPTYNPIKTTGHKRKVSTADHKRNSKKGDVYNNYNNSTYDSAERFPRDIQVFKKDVQKSKLHPTQKPLELFEYLIKTYTNENDLVLDNCMGSGTTGVACNNLNRKFIGIELNEEYFKISRNRINNNKN